MFSAREIYHLAIQIEKNGEKFYRDALEKISNPFLKELIIWVADQELKHQRWFSKRKEILVQAALSSRSVSGACWFFESVHQAESQR